MKAPSGFESAKMEGPSPVTSIVHAVGKVFSIVTRGQAPEPTQQVVEVLASLKMTPRDLNHLYRTFHTLQQFQSRTVTPGPDEISEDSLLTLIAVRRYWVKVLLANLVELGGCRDAISWDAFLYVFLRFCSLSKLELCQCLFYIISKQCKSWTVHYLTSTQLQEFYDFYANCPVQSFSTKSISFTRLPLNRYYMSDFVELVHRFGQLINPLVHLQRSLQQNLPTISFWDDYDRIEVCNRKITLGFFLMTKKKSFMSALEGAHKSAADIMQSELEQRRRQQHEQALAPPPMIQDPTEENDSQLALPFGGSTQNQLALQMMAQNQMALQTQNQMTGAQSMSGLQGVSGVSSTMQGGSTMNDSTLRTAASSPTGLGQPQVGSGTGLMATSPSQPNAQVPQYGTSSSSQFFPTPMPRPTLPQRVLGALRSTFGVPRSSRYLEDEDPGPYGRFQKRPLSPGAADRLRRRKKELPAWIRQYMDLPRRTRMTTRFEEVDFIRKSRTREHHRDNIVSIIERSCPCELLDRPGQGKSKARAKQTLEGEGPTKPGTKGAGKGVAPGSQPGQQAPGSQPPGSQAPR